MNLREQARKAASDTNDNRPPDHKWHPDVIADAASDVWEPLVRYALDAIVAYTGTIREPNKASPEELKLMKAAFDLRHHLGVPE